MCIRDRKRTASVRRIFRNINFRIYVAKIPNKNEFPCRWITDCLLYTSFDGANGSEADGKHQVYDWARYIRTVKELQPGAVTAIMGDDIRWVGNEAGRGRAEEWSATALAPASVGLKDPTPAVEALTRCV